MQRHEYVGDETIIAFIFDGKPFRPFAFPPVNWDDATLHECDNPCCDSYTDDMCRTLIDNQLGEAYLRSINSMGVREVEYNAWQSMRYSANVWRKVTAALSPRISIGGIDICIHNGVDDNSDCPFAEI